MKRYIQPVEGTITSRFDDPRPLSNPGQHVHGALDISAPIGTHIRNPIAGWVSYYTFFRSNKTKSWDEEIKIENVNQHFPYANYSYDIYGSVIIIEEDKVFGKAPVHLICHSYLNQLFNRLDEYSITSKNDWEYQEQKKDERFPMFVFHTLSKPVKVPRGSLIGFVGNAGYSTGPHIHWEIHNTWAWTFYDKRIDPEKYLE